MALATQAIAEGARHITSAHATAPVADRRETAGTGKLDQADFAPCIVPPSMAEGQHCETQFSKASAAARH